MRIEFKKNGKSKIRYLVLMMIYLYEMLGIESIRIISKYINIQSCWN